MLTISLPNTSIGSAACRRSRSLRRDRPRHGSFSKIAAPWHSLKNSLVCELKLVSEHIEHRFRTLKQKHIDHRTNLVRVVCSAVYLRFVMRLHSLCQFRNVIFTQKKTIQTNLLTKNSPKLTTKIKCKTCKTITHYTQFGFLTLQREEQTTSRHW